MITKNTVCFISIITASLLSGGCATTWSEQQRMKLTAVSVQEPTAAKDAYHKPDATLSPGMATAIPVATGGGLIPSLIGSAIDASVKASQQKHFEESAVNYFAPLKAIAADAPLSEVKQEVESCLKSDGFFSSRLTAQAANNFNIQVTRFGLVRSSDATKENMKLCYEIVCRIRLKLGDGETLIDQQVTGASFLGARIEEFIENPALLSDHRKMAIGNLGNGLRGIIDKQLGRIN